jgi:hypothetical protein
MDLCFSLDQFSPGFAIKKEKKKKEKKKKERKECTGISKIPVSILKKSVHQVSQGRNQ